MIKVNDNRIIEKLINSDRIATLNAVGRMKYTKGWEIFADSIDNPKGFILNSDYWKVIYSLYDDVALELLKGLEKGKETGFSGVLKKYYDMLKELRNIKWEEHCYLYYLDAKALDTSRIKHEVGPLRLEDAEIVNEFYTYKSDDSLEYIKECIRERPSSAVYDEKGNPISWAVVREDGSMGIMYTRKEHRGKGLAISVTIDLAKKVIDDDWIPYVHIVTDNKPSIKLAESIGFKRYGEITWFGIE